MFRLPFAAGSVFSASMLDTLLYQAFVKDYVITFVRLLLGVDQAPGSGFLTSMKITKDDMWIRTYGRLYQKLCSTTCEIPIGIYRTQDTNITGSPQEQCSNADDGSMAYQPVPTNNGAHQQSQFNSAMAAKEHSRVISASDWPSGSTDLNPLDYRVWSELERMACHRAHPNLESLKQSLVRAVERFPQEVLVADYWTQKLNAFQGKRYSINMGDEAKDNHTEMIERAEIANLVRSRMESLNLPSIDYDDVSEKRSSLSYVIINPSCDLKLEEGDIIYLIRPSPFSAQKTFERHNSRRKSNISFCSTGLLAGAGAGSRRGSGQYFPPPRPPLSTTKANSLSLPDSPTVAGTFRGRSNSLRVVDDILMRRSNSLRQGLTMRKSSLEEIGLGHYPLQLSNLQSMCPPPATETSGIKIALNGSIGLEVTPPEENSSPSISSNTGLLVAPQSEQLQGTIV
ncbi:unnamed protein product [Nezara viridula]|nr:unnamed protein product [Nezara viridula]